MWPNITERTPTGRAERLIATARAALAAVSLLAIWLDPTEPTRYAEVAYTLLALYLAYALLVLLLAWKTRANHARLGLATHITDLAAFTLFLYFTEGSTSPFFVYYIFSLFCAALRWQRRGTLLTAITVLVLFIGQGLLMQLVLHDPDFELNRFIIRSVYLAGVALMLVYLTSFEERTRRDLANLARWRDDTAGTLQAVAKGTLEQAAVILRAPRALLLWDDAEEPFRYLATLDGATFRWQEAAPDAFDPPLAVELAGTDFIFVSSGGTASVLSAAGDSQPRRSGSPFHPALQALLGNRCVLCLALRGEDFTGWLLFSGRDGMTDDDLHLGGLVARQVGAAMSRFYLQQRLQHTAAMETRIRLARDLHDGLLQSLTGVALQLEQIRRAPAAGDDALSERLGAIQTLVQEEQRALRGFIQQIKPEADVTTVQQPQTLDELGAGIARRWGIPVAIEIAPAAHPLADAADTRYLLQEALANSAKHARASRIDARLDLKDGLARIRVADDGQGFAFRGRYRLGELQHMRQGPRSLMARVADLGGDLVIESGSAGSVLEITFPWHPATPSTSS